MSRTLRDLAPIRTSLTDGMELLIRPIQVDDRERVKQCYHWLSEDSRMNRFWEKPQEMSELWVDRLIGDNEGRHICWVGLNPSDLSFPGYGGGSLWQDEHDESLAEISFTIGDPWQRSGMATLFYSVLYLEGWRMGIRRLEGYCRLTNKAMVSWWEGIGGKVVRGRHQFSLSLELEEPNEFLSRVAYQMPPAPRRVEVAEWIALWAEKLES